MDESLTQSAGKTDTIEVVGFERRLVAIFIDSLIVSMLQLAVTMLAWFWIRNSAFETGAEPVAVEPNPLLNILFLLCLLIPLVYFVSFWAVMGQTPGKSAVGIKVISIDGSSISWGKAIIRYIGYLISSPLALGFIWVTFDAKRQGWHDKIAGTYVVRKEARLPSSSVTAMASSNAGQNNQIISGGVLLALFLFLTLFLLPILAMAILMLIRRIILY